MVKINEIIIVVFGSRVFPNQNKVDPSRAKKRCSTQYIAIEKVELI